MIFSGICITTDNVKSMAEFYKIALQKEPCIEGNHYSFGNIAIYNPGEARNATSNSIWLQCFVADVDAEYERLLRQIPDLNVISPPKKKPWGAYSFWIADPDGNRLAVAEKKDDNEDAEPVNLRAVLDCRLLCKKEQLHETVQHNNA